MQKDEGTKSYAAVYLFFEHNPSPPLPLNALHRNALQARQKKKMTRERESLLYTAPSLWSDAL